MTTKQCNDYGLKCLQCPHWNHWTNFCTKWKITTDTSGDGMTEKRYTYNVNKNTIECDEKFVAYVNCVDGFRIANKMNVFQKENEQLKQSFKEILKDLEVSTFNKELLEKENEQLKQENRLLKGRIQEYEEQIER